MAAEEPPGRAWVPTDPASRRPGLGRSRPCVSRGRVPAEPGLQRRVRRERAGGRNEPRSHEDSPEPGQEAPDHRNSSSGSGELRRAEKRGRTVRPQPGTNCCGGPSRKLRLLTDGAPRQRLQLPEATARGPQTPWQCGRFHVRKRLRHSWCACAHGILPSLGGELYFPACSGARERRTPSLVSAPRACSKPIHSQTLSGNPRVSGFIQRALS